ncbi:MAG: peptide chain release factor N(5)-glutamine methyltransferase [Clostridia bacterium]|nr:peptide chain release factor N(5)-glutamine methyltransferase [Clostridia bacterium]
MKILNDAGVSPASFNTDLLLEHFAGITKLMFLTESNLTVSEKVANTVINAAKECGNGIPLQHILGYTEFMGIKFNVNENVLIPRPDTEILVTEAIKCAEKIQEQPKILDMCTGSGCIAIALSHFLKNAEIHASDISEKALATAKRNAAEQPGNTEITFHSGSFFVPFAAKVNCTSSENSKFDIIVSNPPYIPTDDIKELSVNVRLHEPMSALDGGADGLSAYREIISEAPLYLNKNGMILFEVGVGQADDVRKLLKKDFTDIYTVRDYGGIERVVYGKLI